MQTLKIRTFALGMPLAVALSLCVACGGSSDNDDDKMGQGGTGSMSNGGSSAGGGTKAGSGNSSGSGNSTAGTGSNTAGTGSGGDFSTDVPGDKPLGELSDGELDQLCDDIAEHISTSSFADSQLEFSCRLSGMLTALFGGAETDAALQAACKVAYDACKAMPEEPATGECEKPDASRYHGRPRRFE
jgi:hypothetical protein